MFCGLILCDKDGVCYMCTAKFPKTGLQEQKKSITIEINIACIYLSMTEPYDWVTKIRNLKIWEKWLYSRISSGENRL